MQRIGKGPTMSTRILRPLQKDEKPQILAIRRTRLTSGKARQHPIPMLVASLLIPKPNVVIVAKQNIMIAKKQCKAYGQQCKKCNKMNHFQCVCLSNSIPNFGDKTNRVGCINVVCKRARVQDDSEPTPLMKDVKI